jgi:hypothetical protein
MTALPWLEIVQVGLLFVIAALALGLVFRVQRDVRRAEAQSRRRRKREKSG